MKKGLVICGFVLFLAVALTGCVRTYVTTKDRVDIEVAGNQGVIYGPTPAPHNVPVTTRDIYAVDVELPTMGEAAEAVTPDASAGETTPDKSTEGNAGIVSEPSQTQEKIK